LTPERLATRLIAILDLIALLSLLGTTEIASWVFLASASLALISFSLRVYLKKRFILPNPIALSFILALIGLGFYLWRKSGLHPLFAVSHIAPLVLSLLWLSFQDRLNRAWRLGMGFICLILAASLTPELYMPFSILVFLLVSSLLISAEFLSRELSVRDPDLLSKPLPAKFIRGSLLRSFVILLSSLLIFPILPRPKGIWKAGFGPTKQDYTEEVDLSSWLSDSEAGKGEPRLRVFLPDENKNSLIEMVEYFPNLLIRGRTLEIFNGVKWLPGPPEKAQRAGIPSEGFNKNRVINIIREPLPSKFLPVPYNTLSVGGEFRTLPGLVKNIKQEWHMIYRLSKRLQYSVYLKDIKFGKAKGKKPYISDPVGNHHLELPKMLTLKRWSKALTEIQGNLKVSDQKFAEKLSLKIKNHFRKTGFTTDLKSGDANYKNPLEKFMFEIKDGHCELFAGSTATLLRLAGIPARLVAGFRISGPPSQGVLTIRSGDAHAWVEFWSKSEKQWFTLDPTPMRAAAGSNNSELLSMAYEVMTAYWYKYILSFDQQDSIKNVGIELSNLGTGIKKLKKESFFKKITSATQSIEQFLIVLVFLILLSFSIYIIYKFKDTGLNLRNSKNSLNSERLNSLDKKREKLEKLLFKKGYIKKGCPVSYRLDKQAYEQNLTEKSSSLLNQWFEIYEKVRFGPGSFSSKDFKKNATKLNALYKSFKTSLA
jgi:hypothetical protein